MIKYNLLSSNMIEPHDEALSLANGPDPASITEATRSRIRIEKDQASIGELKLSYCHLYAEAKEVERMEEEKDISESMKAK